MPHDSRYDRNLPEFGPLDRAFADFICRLAGNDSPPLWLAVACLSAAFGRGNVCLELPLLAGEPAAAAAKAQGFADLPDSPWRDAGRWVEELRRFNEVAAPGGIAPLVLDDCGRLYLHRYWSYEHSLAEALRDRGAAIRGDVDETLLASGLDRLFPPLSAPGSDWQRLATALAVCRSLTVIAGGPGTGKTTTVVRILALLIEQAAGRPFNVALAAPTGKAAARLKEAVAAALERLPLPDDAKLLIPSEAITLHRLLGIVPGSVRGRYNRDNPLPYDLVVVDEASMVDLPLMARLVEALPSSCRLILMGDPDQLASVESGAVLGDICHPAWLDVFSPLQRSFFQRVVGGAPAQPAAGAIPILCDAVVKLKTSHRFGGNSGIGTVGRLVNEGRGGEAIERLRQGGDDVAWHELPSPAELPARLKERLAAGYGRYLESGDPESCLDLFGRFRILSPLRKGAYGVEALNGIAERALAPAGHAPSGSAWYRHRPVMVTGNDYQLRLANGDIGIALPETGATALSVWFPATAGGVRQISPLRLSDCETAYAMTVHKSQGSEFDAILLLLPDAMPELLTRELIYTAITRARSRVEIWGTEASFIAAVSRRVRRNSGLRESLWGVE